MNIVTGTQHKVVTQKTRLGSIPKSQFVSSKAFVPDRVGMSTENSQDVFRESPVLDSQGQLMTKPVNFSMEVKPHSPLTSGLISAGIATVISGVVSGFSPGAMITSALIAGGTGAAAVLGDEATLGYKDQTVTKPVLDGYKTYSTDSAFIPGRQKNWFNDSGGTQFTVVENIKDVPVGKVQVPVVEHSTPEAARWVVPQALAVAAALMF